MYNNNSLPNVNFIWSHSLIDCSLGQIIFSTYCIFFTVSLYYMYYNLQMPGISELCISLVCSIAHVFMRDYLWNTMHIHYLKYLFIYLCSCCFLVSVLFTILRPPFWLLFTSGITLYYYYYLWLDLVIIPNWWSFLPLYCELSCLWLWMIVTARKWTHLYEFPWQFSSIFWN